MICFVDKDSDRQAKIYTGRRADSPLPNLDKLEEEVTESKKDVDSRNYLEAGLLKTSIEKKSKQEWYKQEELEGREENVDVKSKDIHKQ